jgi:hypothetical protein
MRVLLDECLPRRLGLELVGHLVSTVPQAGWAGISNGKLLALIDGHYDAFVTADKNLPAQQKTASLSFGVIVLRSSIIARSRETISSREGSIGSGCTLPRSLSCNPWQALRGRAGLESEALRCPWS